MGRGKRHAPNSKSCNSVAIADVLTYLFKSLKCFVASVYYNCGENDSITTNKNNIKLLYCHDKGIHKLTCTKCILKIVQKFKVWPFRIFYEFLYFWSFLKNRFISKFQDDRDYLLYWRLLITWKSYIFEYTYNTNT